MRFSLFDKFSRTDSSYEEQGLLLDEGKYIQGGNVTNLNAFWNLCNSIQGVAILAMPRIIMDGGWWSVLSLIIVATVSNYTGQILIECHYDYLYDIDGQLKKKVRVRSNMADVGRAVWPSFGMSFVLAIQVLELLLMATLYPIVTGSILSQLVPNISTSFWILIFGIVMLPNIFLKNLKHISWLSFSTVISATLVFSVVVIYSLTKVSSWNIKLMNMFNLKHFPLSVAVIVASYSSQMYVVVIEGNMNTPERFGYVMNYAYIAMTILKIGTGMAAYLTFQGNTAQVVTLNLSDGMLHTCVNVIVVILAMSSYTLPMFRVFEILKETCHKFTTRKIDKTQPPDRKQIFDVCFIMMNLGLVLITILMAILFPHFCLVLSFIGTFTGACLIFIFPCIFHLTLYFHSMELYKFVADIIILLFGITFMIVCLYFTGNAMIFAYTHHTKETWI